jgi:hypothetical protein
MMKIVRNGCFMEIWAAALAVRSWPKAPVDAPGLNDRCRDIAPTGGVKSNDGKGSNTVID